MCVFLWNFCDTQEISLCYLCVSGCIWFSNTIYYGPKAKKPFKLVSSILFTLPADKHSTIRTPVTTPLSKIFPSLYPPHTNNNPHLLLNQTSATNTQRDSRILSSSSRERISRFRNARLAWVHGSEYFAP